MESRNAACTDAAAVGAGAAEGAAGPGQALLPQEVPPPELEPEPHSAALPLDETPEVPSRRALVVQVQERAEAPLLVRARAARPMRQVALLQSDRRHRRPTAAR
jgi:hypothetical protein